MINAAKQSGLKKDKLFNFRPAFFAAVFLILGIVFAYYRILHGVSAWWLLLLLPIAITPFFFAKGREDAYRRMLALSLLGIAFLTGFVTFRSQLYGYTDCTYYQGDYAVTGTVVKTSKGKQSVLVVLEGITIDGKEEEGQLNAYLPASFFDELQIADVLLIEGRVKTATDYFGKYGFEATKIGDNIRYTLSAVEGCVVAGRSDNLFLLVRRRMEKVVYAGMDETTASVTMAVLTGDTAGIEEGLLDNMRFGGIAHIFAVSGLHVGALYAFCLLLFNKTKMRFAPKPLRFLLLAFLLIFYAGVCGFSASILRAMTLCLVSYFMRLIGTKADGINVLGIAAVFILLLTPSALFEIGFQLSFMASMGILLLSKRIGQVCDELYIRFRKRFPRRLSEAERKTIESGDTLPSTMGENVLRFFLSLSISCGSSEM
jgi:ComEC/Rec2-related protein